MLQMKLQYGSFHIIEKSPQFIQKMNCGSSYGYLQQVYTGIVISFLSSIPLSTFSCLA